MVSVPVLLTAIGAIVAPLIIWAVKIERRLERGSEREADNTREIIDLKADAKETSKIIQNNHTEVMKGLNNIQLQLKDKADR